MSAPRVEYAVSVSVSVSGRAVVLVVDDGASLRLTAAQAEQLAAALARSARQAGSWSSPSDGARAGGAR